MQDQPPRDPSQLRDHLLPVNSSVRTVLERLNKVFPKLCLLVDDAGAIVRTVSDGDVRRGLLGGVMLDSSVSKLPARAPVTAPAEACNAMIMELMTREQVPTVVLTDGAGRPVGMKSFPDIEDVILLSPPHIGTSETGYVRQAFESNWVAPAGPNLEAFEARLAEISGRRHALALSSGTAGLHLAIRALDLPRDAAIYVSDKTFAASVQPVLYEGLEPVLIDAEPSGWNISPEALQRRLDRDAARGHLPGAIIVVHLYGQPVQLDKILALAEQYEIPVIEDAAESLGATYHDRPTGAHGMISVYSFNGNKILTTSGGGAVLTDDPELDVRMRYLATQGRGPYEHYQHAHIAYNYRMSNILAGIGLGQLEVLGERVERRRTLWSRYYEGLMDLPGIGFQDEPRGGVGNRWLTVITLDPDHVGLHPYQVLRALKQRGIETRPSWKPMHMQPLCHEMSFEPHSDHEVVSASLFLRGLCLPSGSNLSDAEQDYVISSLRGILTRGHG